MTVLENYYGILVALSPTISLMDYML